MIKSRKSLTLAIMAVCCMGMSFAYPGVEYIVLGLLFIVLSEINDIKSKLP